jgi:hypothetical protein
MIDSWVLSAAELCKGGCEEDMAIQLVEGIAGRQLWTRVDEGRTWARKAEESPLLDAVAKKRLVKTQQAGKGLAGAVVNCKVMRLAMAL